ncbi:MAG TPA: hypothetical protein VG015_08220 [Candidatus Dormibacteraeota bacterium]|nr:hypothetical protein [Candidatus Dormibacteraeota bacterium]
MREQILASSQEDLWFPPDVQNPGIAGVQALLGFLPGVRRDVHLPSMPGPHEGNGLVSGHNRHEYLLMVDPPVRARIARSA